ncbi:MAG: ABC transporter ATP-binding protein [Methanomicrobiales archaeon]|nr:ABC transporter ATP-binding protein [Methanomicrobiales archaeon]
MLEVAGITKQIGGLTAVNGVDLRVKQGEIVGLVGPNGAGKTTLMNVISGLTRSSAGRVHFCGEEITNLAPEKICKKGIAKTFQIPHSFPDLPSRQAVMVGVLFGNHKKYRMEEADARATQLLEFVGLSREKWDAPVKNLNAGEMKKVQLARALASEPKLLLLDELMTGLTPTEINESIHLIRKIRDSGISIILTEHIMHVIMGVSDRIIVLDHGEQIAEGDPQQVAKDARVIETYLGEPFGC